MRRSRRGWRKRCASRLTSVSHSALIRQALAGRRQTLPRSVTSHTIPEPSGYFERIGRHLRIRRPSPEARRPIRDAVPRGGPRGFEVSAGAERSVGGNGATETVTLRSHDHRVKRDAKCENRHVHFHFLCIPIIVIRYRDLQA